MRTPEVFGQLTVGCKACSWTHQVVLAEAPIGAISAFDTCPNCRNPAYSIAFSPVDSNRPIKIEDIVQIGALDLHAFRRHPLPSRPVKPESSLIPDDSPKTMSSFQTRVCAPLLLSRELSRVMSEQGDSTIPVEEARGIFLVEGKRYRDSLLHEEAKSRVPRGGRASAGFPITRREHKERLERRGGESSLLSKIEKSDERWAGANFGYCSTGSPIWKGGVFQLGIIALESEGRVGFTRNGTDLLRNMGDEPAEPDESGNKTRLITERDAEAFIALVEQTLPIELEFMREVGNQIFNFKSFSEIVVELALSEIKRTDWGGETENAWWRVRGGFAVSRIIEERGREIELVVDDMATKITPYLSSLFGRMNDMGMISKRRFGSSMEYRINQSGAYLLDLSF